MPDQSGGIIDKIFFLIAFLVLAFVAVKPAFFIRSVTLGRSSSADVSDRMLRVTQVIAGIAALSIAISFIVDLFKDAR